MKSFLILSSVALAVFLGYRTMSPSELPDITEARAKWIAETTVDEFCGQEKEQCPTTYYFMGSHPPADDRFKWGYKFDATYAEPPRRVVVSVSGKGEKTLEFVFISPDEVAAAAQESAGVEASP